MTFCLQTSMACVDTIHVKLNFWLRLKNLRGIWITEIAGYGTEIDLQILDFSKAFDKVPHQRLINKLLCDGIQDNTLTWITSWLTKRSQRVIVDGEACGSVNVTSGVPPGIVLEPLMFLLFLLFFDNHENLDSNLRLFADDAVLYRSITTVNDSVVLQRDIDELVSWSKK